MTAEGPLLAEIEQRGLAPFGALAGVEWDVRGGIRVKGGVLSWPVESRVMKRHRDPLGEYWLRFLAIGDLEGAALDQAVRSYARRWGPLHLCEAHGLPVTHPPHISPGKLASFGGPQPCPPKVVDGRVEEPVDRWRELARQAGAVLMARADLDEGHMVPQHRLAAMTGALPLGYSAPGTPPMSIPAKGRVQGALGYGAIGPMVIRLRLSKEQAVGIAAEQWLAMSDVAPRFRWEGGDFALSFRSGTLFGALALRLAGGLTDARPLVKCDYGNHWYPQSRRGTYFCRSEECNRARLAENARRRRAGRSRQYRARSGAAASKQA